MNRVSGKWKFYMLVAKDSVILYNGIQHKEGRPTKCIEQNKNQAEEKMHAAGAGNGQFRRTDGLAGTGG
mgnify:CR=1 FL=1